MLRSSVDPLFSDSQVCQVSHDHVAKKIIWDGGYEESLVRIALFHKAFDNIPARSSKF